MSATSSDLRRAWRRSGVVALALGALLLSGGCVKYARESARQPGQSEGDWFTSAPPGEVPPAEAEFAPPLESGSVFEDFRRSALEHYPAAARMSLEVWLAPDVSGDCITDNIYAASVMLARDMGAYFLSPGDTLHVVPWDIELRGDLRQKVTFPVDMSQEEVWQTVADKLPRSAQQLTQGRPSGGLLTDCQYALVQEALNSSDRTRGKLIIVLTNLVTDNPWRHVRPRRTGAEVAALLKELTGGAGEFRHGEWKPPPVDVPQDVKLYAFYSAATRMGGVVPGATVNRERVPPSGPAARPPPPPEPQGPSPAATIILLLLSLIGLAALTFLALGLTVEVVVQAAGSVPTTSDLRALSDGRGRIVANAAAAGPRTWSIPWEGLGARSLARVTCAWGVTLVAASGVKLGTKTGQADKVPLRFGQTERVRVVVGSQVQEITVTVGQLDSGHQALLTVAALVILVLLIAFLAA